MADLIAKRTLVKSPPELWTELSEVESLARHLGELGEIRITKVEPETAVAWEGEHASGTVEIEASGWGTKVTLRATVSEAPPAQEEEPAKDPSSAPAVPTPSPPRPASAPPPPEPAVAAPSAAPQRAAPPARPAPAPPAGPYAPRMAARPRPESQRRGFLGRLFGRRRAGVAAPERPGGAAVQRPPSPPPAALGQAPRQPEPSPHATPAATPSPPPVPEARPAAPQQPATARERPAPARRPPPRTEEHRPIAAAEPAPRPRSLEAEAVLAVLESTLDSLGSAHHRPFSRE